MDEVNDPMSKRKRLTVDADKFEQPDEMDKAVPVGDLQFSPADDEDDPTDAFADGEPEGDGDEDEGALSLQQPVEVEL